MGEAAVKQKEMFLRRPEGRSAKIFERGLRTGCKDVAYGHYAFETWNHRPIDKEEGYKAL